MVASQTALSRFEVQGAHLSFHCLQLPQLTPMKELTANNQNHSHALHFLCDLPTPSKNNPTATSASVRALALFHLQVKLCLKNF